MCEVKADLYEEKVALLELPSGLSSALEGDAYFMGKQDACARLLDAIFSNVLSQDELVPVFRRCVQFACAEFKVSI